MHKPIFDAHLDLAWNGLTDRDITQPAAQQPARTNETATVGLPDLRQGQVTHVCATIFCLPHSDEHAGYTNPDEAHAQAIAQLDFYDALRAKGELSYAHDDVGDAGKLPRVMLLMEGAECVRSPEDVAMFYARGVRIVGLAWQRTRYAGGTATPGPLTDQGRELVRVLDQLQIIHDASHLSEQSFWDLMRVAEGRVIASHSNCRDIVGHDPYGRHLTDDMIRVIVQRGGVVGINFFDRFLLPHAQYNKRRVTLKDVIAHVRHVCDLAGSVNHVGIGTDMDGGLGRDQIPEEIKTSADMPHLRDALAAAAFSTDDIDKILFANWMRVLRLA